MSQHDFDLANQNGPAFRADLNNLIAALASQNAGNTAPPTTFPFLFWADTSVTPNLLRMRNAADSAWLELGDLTQANLGLAKAASISGTLSKNVGGNSNVTLSAAEAEKGIITLTGTLTGNINVIVPTAAYQWVFNNQTSGAYSVTVKTASGTGVAIFQAASTALYCDGTNVNTSGAQPTITATGLLKGEGGGVVSAAVAGTDYQAPVTATGMLKGAGGGSVGAAVAGTDFVHPGTATSFTKTQTAAPSALTHNTGWDASAIQNATVNVNGSAFTIANPSTNCATGSYVAVTVTYTTTHSISWGANFKNVATITPSATAGKSDFFLFQYDGTRYCCCGYALDFKKA